MSTPLPAAFLQMLDNTGCKALQQLSENLQSPSPISIRINIAKGGKSPADCTPVEWCSNGYYLNERPQFIFDPALHQGLYYVQDASSMAHATAVAKACSVIDLIDNRSIRYLDACAAPGGKTTAAIDVLPEGSFIVANEFDPRRTSILIENIAKWGYDGVVVTREDASKIKGLDNYFDIIAADVPCSGEGMMRKDPQAIAQWTQALVAECAARQRLIVDNLWRTLRPGGCLIYSTCTFNCDENEHIIRHIIDDLGGIPIEIEQLQRPEIINTINDNFPSYRFIPGYVRGEGQYIALLQKPGNDTPTKSKAPKDKKQKGHDRIPEIATKLLNGDWSYIINEDTINAIRTSHAEEVATIGRNCYVVSQGIELGVIKGRDFIPSQSLAMARALKDDAFNRAEVDYNTAIEYLQRKAITPPDSPRGIVLLTYNQHPLGFIKNLGNRANNLYPTPWRILSELKK